MWTLSTIILHVDSVHLIELREPDDVYAVHHAEATMTAAPPRPSGRRPPGQVRSALIAAGLDLARAGGPDAVVLREATRRVGVAPNAVYRHFADLDALLADVGAAAMGELARRMREQVAAVPVGGDPKETAIARLGALGEAYLGFATDETGLFETAFAVPRHLEYAAGTAGEGPGPMPFQLLGAALDDLVAAGVLPAGRRPDAEYPVWSCVHGLAVLVTRGPLRDMPEELRPPRRRPAVRVHHPRPVTACASARRETNLAARASRAARAAASSCRACSPSGVRPPISKTRQ